MEDSKTGVIRKTIVEKVAERIKELEKIINSKKPGGALDIVYDETRTYCLQHCQEIKLEEMGEIFNESSFRDLVKQKLGDDKLYNKVQDKISLALGECQREVFKELSRTITNQSSSPKNSSGKDFIFEKAQKKSE